MRHSIRMFQRIAMEVLNKKKKSTHPNQTTNDHKKEPNEKKKWNENTWATTTLSEDEQINLKKINLHHDEKKYWM